MKLEDFLITEFECAHCGKPHRRSIYWIQHQELFLCTCGHQTSLNQLKMEVQKLTEAMESYTP
ncbi:hypothetical protein [Algicola sagamiensis]|uniref:hypothetical protein n=1 Tax=Algicola sagamiensis TaxID=163869 RepID=UPI000372696A|nr:hypothetical protein [Algicola sagamiensis]